MADSPTMHDLLVVGAGPTGIAIGAAAREAGLDALLVDRGGLCGSLRAFPHDMYFFTTRDKLEIADMPFGIPEDKPTRRQALAYYQGVARRFGLQVAAGEEVVGLRGEAGAFEVRTRVAADQPKAGVEILRAARAVALAQGYFARPKKLEVPGEDLPWVSSRYYEPDGHFGRHVLIVGGGNSAVEAALDLWRHGVRVTLVHRRAAIKPTIKYWVKPDFQNRVEEGSIAARLETSVRAFEADGTVLLAGPDGESRLAVDAAYVLIGYQPELTLAAQLGVAFEGEDGIPSHDPATCESNVPGLYIAGTLLAGRRTDKIFIENSRDHGHRIVGHLLGR
jgi:thioredoxin reductase (NADPH)